MRLVWKLIWHTAFVVMVAMLAGWLAGGLLIEAGVWEPVSWQ